eukprot:TRINITY_DN1213_c0_g1_i1.p1 TRINITY_DN1213_c0_g1~~TRINITY_DN1213_c0_g1_i1.p1  ORF type:complete len:175 (+),score=44.66 TRINITY_DN1213_c0_g1_i1:61-525(+)
MVETEDTLFSTPLAHVKPCTHNCWEDVRTRKRNKILRCIECSNKWKVSASDISRCPSFLSTSKCALGEQCPKLHVFKKVKTKQYTETETDSGSLNQETIEVLTWSTSSDEVVSTGHGAAYCESDVENNDNGGVHAMTEEELDAHVLSVFGMQTN